MRMMGDRPVRRGSAALAAVLLGWIACGAAGARAEEPASDEWKFTHTFYAWATSLNGDVTVKGVEADVDASFHDILKEEVDEGLDLAAKYEKLAADHGGQLPKEHAVDVLADMSDWLGDIVVYCASEARRWGIPMPDVLRIIMESNFSKLGADGKPIYDERGKVMKGPNYWKPEPKIREMYNGSPR